MNIEHFIAKRLALSQTGPFTKVIIRIAIAAIAVSLTVMILTTSIITGFKREISNKIFGFWGHIDISDSSTSRNFELVPIDKNEKHYHDISDIKQVEYQRAATILGIPLEGKVVDKKTIGGVQGVYPYIMLPGLLGTKENFHGMILKGVDVNYDWDRMSKFIKNGSKLTLHKDTASSQLLLSKNIAERMKIKTGDKVIVSFIRGNEQIKRRFQICGLYNTGLEEYDKRFALADIRKLQEVLDWTDDQVQGMEVVLDHVEDMDVISDYIYYETLPQKYYAESIKSKFPSIFEWLKLQDINEKIILMLMIVVAIINMITVLLILILERTNMIGILKALGMNNWKIRKIFIYQAAYIVFFGLLIGNVLGISLALAQRYFQFITLDEANYYLDTAPIEIRTGTIVLLNICTFIITLIALILPTLLVTRITPVKALRFD
jgi:lipoprotein-releasing system permease protein